MNSIAGTKAIIILLISLLVWLFQSQIKWTADKKLKWNDFEKVLAPGAKEYATLTGGIDCDGLKLRNDSTVAGAIFAYCDKSQSSKIADSKQLTEEILRHEQGHFDIWEWYARILRKKLADTTLYKLSQINATINYVSKEAYKMQDQYDSETYSLNYGKLQIRWDSIIAHKLEEYSAYSGTEVEIHLKKNRIKH